MLTYVIGNPAGFSIEADMKLHTDAKAPAGTVSDGLPDIYGLPGQDPSIKITQHSIAFVLEDSLLIHGWPAARAPLMALATASAGINTGVSDASVPAPTDLSLAVTMRWLPTADTFTPGVGWVPSIGSGLSWSFDDSSSPYLDEGYSFAHRGGEAAMPAVVFADNSWAQLDQTDWSAAGFTFVLVLVPHPNAQSGTFGILESDTTDIDSPGTVDWGLRYANEAVSLHAGAGVANHHLAAAHNRAIVIAVALDQSEGKFVVADRSLTTLNFAANGMSVYDMFLYLARTGGDYDVTTTAQMALLDLCYYDHALGFDEIADVVHQLDAVYGITG
jgi:hypothetical protein